MVRFGSECLTKKDSMTMKLSLVAFDYHEMFVWSSQFDTFDPTTESTLESTKSCNT